MKTSSSIRLALFGAIILLTTTSFAGGKPTPPPPPPPPSIFQTVDDFQYIAGFRSENQGLTVAPNGVLFATGYAEDSITSRALVIASGDNGATWSAPLENFDFGGWGVYNIADIVSDSAGNLYAAYTGMPTSDTGVDMHWLVRRTADAGATWATVEDWDPGSGITQLNGITADNAGNVYTAGAAGSATHPEGWVVRKGVGGTNFSTVDSFPITGILSGVQSVFAHPTAGIFAVGANRGQAAYAWVVRRSSDGGATWQTVDNFQMPGQSPALAKGVGADAMGNLYVVGVGGASYKGNLYWHWIVRKSVNGGITWSTVDDYQLSSSANSYASRLSADSTGNLYVAGNALDAEGKQHWIVRMNPAGTGTWQTVENFQYRSGTSSVAEAITANASGSVFVGGWGTGTDGSAHWLVRKH